ncbi:hypothetical protein ACMFMF_007856 [Clarireedia jacksonii]
MNKFEYEPLDDNSSAFRLLILSPGTGDSPLDCTLIEDSQEVSTFSYEALSYTWGDSSTLQHIRLNNRLFFVTPNLYAALQHLRLADVERILWVDAQVSRMRSIYQAAKRVLVWLGEGSEKTFRALSWVGSHSKADRKDLKHLKKATRAIMDACPERSIEPDNDKLDSQEHETQDRRVHLLECFNDLLGRPWWSRIWVVQEVAVNSDVKIICGHSEVSWTTFMVFVQGIYDSKPLLQAPLEEITKYKRAIERGFSRQQFACQSSQEISDLLLRHRGLDSSDPRDNVYALLGLASNMMTSKFLPDYSKPLDMVYKHLTKEIVKHHNNLTIICASQPSSSPHSNLPSWVPDWSSSSTSFCFAQAPYNACSYSTPDVKFSKDLSKLKVRGFSLATIESLSVKYESSGPHLVDWLTTVRNWRTLIGNWDSSSRPFTVDDFRQIYAHHVPNSVLSYPVDLRYQTRRPAKKRSKKDMIRFHTHMNAMCWNRRLANVRRKRARAMPMSTDQGLVPVNAVPGDEICILHGCRVPVILRKYDEKNWIFIGDAYIDGCMNGETFTTFSGSDYTQIFSIK